MYGLQGRIQECSKGGGGGGASGGTSFTFLKNLNLVQNRGGGRGRAPPAGYGVIAEELPIDKAPK